MCASAGDVPDRAAPFKTLNENMLDFFFLVLMDNLKGIFTKETSKQKRFMTLNLTLFIVIIVIIIIIVIQIIYFHCLVFFYYIT